MVLSKSMLDLHIGASAPCSFHRLLAPRLHLCTHPLEVILQNLVERWNQRLGQPERERELRSRHQQLRHQALEEGRRTLYPRHIAHNPEARLLGLEVAVLYARLDHIQRRRDDERGRRSGNGRNEILQPRRTVVVLHLVQVLLSCCRPAEQRKGARRIARGGPAPASVQPKPLVGDDAQEAAVAECLWVRLTLDLEHIQRQQHDLTNTDDAAGRGVHDGLAVALAKGIIKARAVVLGQVVAHEGLAAVLVDALQDLVGGGVAEAREEREEASGHGGRSLILEDDAVELRGGGYAALVRHQTLGGCVHGMENHELCDARAS